MQRLEEPGLSWSLAENRVNRISRVHYDLAFHMVPGMEEVEGSLALRFTLDSTAGEGVWLDFDGSYLDATWSLNRTTLTEAPLRRNNHLWLPGEHLQAGENHAHFRFRSKVAATGTPLNVYKDSADGAEYYYTLVVPADAHRLFPCFDQPNIKGRFRFEITAPRGWQVVANGERQQKIELPDGLRTMHRFAASRPISTYLMAFAAGPFTVEEGPLVKVNNGTTRKPLRIFYRPVKDPDVDQETLFRMHAECLEGLSEDFASDYPFAKLDFVLVPGFPYGGMEHPGAIFYRESALAFDHVPSEAEWVRRSTLIYHEVSHQWFGNLVTMDWFDDLWLKEGFATFAGYSMLERLEPERNAWLRFHQWVKPPAYRVDVTAGTVPVYQELPNMADAKSNYGPIVYNKAPAVLRALHDWIGNHGFQDGVRQFLRDYGWANARWDALIAAMESASATKLDTWSSRWLLTAGMPKIWLDWQADSEGRITHFQLRQESIQGGNEHWPMMVEFLAAYEDGRRETHAVEFTTGQLDLTQWLGKTAPRWVLLNPGDVAYGQFLLDSQSRHALLEDLPLETDPLIRAVGFSALYETVREAQLHPRAFAELCIRLLEDERDPLTHGQFLGALTTTLSRYMASSAAAALRRQASEMLLRQLLTGDLRSMELQVFRSLVRLGSSEEILQLCRDYLEGQTPVPHLSLGTQDKFLALAALIAAETSDAEDWLQRMEHDDSVHDAAKYAYLAAAARPTARAKQDYFESYLQPDEPPEQWIQLSLQNFHWRGQSELTLPYLKPALEQVEWVKANRKIFFMPSWLNAFINAHSSAEALAVVEAFLEERSDLSIDIRRKLLQSIDGLRRAVKIRQTFDPGT